MAKVKRKKKIKLTENQRIRREAMLLTDNATSLFRRQMLDKLLNPGKDINYECGYPDTIEVSEYKAMYEREGVGTRVVKLMPEECWSLMPEIYENEKIEETKFEKEWKELDESMHLLSYLQRVDDLSGIGRFGLILFGLSDGKNLDRPVPSINEKTGEATGKAKLKLLYLRTFDESVVQIDKRETDTSSPRYGMPTMYKIDFEVSGSESTAKQTKQVHWTRVLHVTDNRGMSEVFGIPRMKYVFNRLLDIRKIVAGSGEMFWQGGFPGTSFTTKDGMDDVTIDTDSLKEQLLEYRQGMQRFLAVAGMEIKSLAPQIADPKGHMEIQIRYICITLGCPYRIFMGSEEAKLASSQDTEAWNKRIAKRQTSYLTPLLVKPFIDRLMVYGILTESKEYFVNWPDLSTPSEKDESEVALSITDALAKYTTSGMAVYFPLHEYLTIVLHFDDEEAEAIVKASEEQALELEEEEQKFREENPEEEEVVEEEEEAANKDKSKEEET